MRAKRGEARFLVQDAYVDLLKEHSYDQIRVIDLTRKSGVSKSSFYKHFGCALDVLESIEKDLLDNLSFYAKHDNPIEAMAIWVRSCVEQKRRLRAVMGPNGDPYFSKRLQVHLRDGINCMMDDDGLPDDRDRRFTVEVIASMYVGIVLSLVVNSDFVKTEADITTVVQVMNVMRIGYHKGVEGAPPTSDARLFGEHNNDKMPRLETD
jgi:AcrR family transcriptional regulator